MYFANTTGGIHGCYYYVNFAGNSNNHQIKSLQEIIKNAIFILVFHKKWVIYRHIVPLKQNKIVSSLYRIHTKIYELFGVLCPPNKMVQVKKCMYLVHFASPKLDFGGHLEF